MLKKGTPASPATAREHSLAGAGRPDQQDTLWQLGAERAKALRVGEVVDDLLQVCLGVLESGDLVKAGIDLFGLDTLRLGLANPEDPAALAVVTTAHHPSLHAVAEVEEESEDQDPWQQGDQHAPEETGLGRLCIDLDLMRLEQVEQLWVLHLGQGTDEMPAEFFLRRVALCRVAGFAVSLASGDFTLGSVIIGRLARGAVLGVIGGGLVVSRWAVSRWREAPVQPFALEGHLRDLALTHRLFQLGVRELLRCRGA